MSMEQVHFYLFLLPIKSSSHICVVFVKLTEETHKTKNIKWDLKIFSHLKFLYFLNVENLESDVFLLEKRKVNSIQYVHIYIYKYI